MKRMITIIILVTSCYTFCSCNSKEEETKEDEQRLLFNVTFEPSDCGIVSAEGDTIDIFMYLNDGYPPTPTRITTIFDNVAYFGTEINLDSLRKTLMPISEDFSNVEYEIESPFLKIHVRNGREMNIVVFPLDTISRAWHAISFIGGTFFIKQNSTDSKWE